MYIYVYLGIYIYMFVCLSLPNLIFFIFVCSLKCNEVTGGISLIISYSGEIFHENKLQPYMLETACYRLLWISNLKHEYCEPLVDSWFHF